VIRLRTTRRWGADHIAHEVGLAASTVQNILRAQGLGRLDRGDRATDRGDRATDRGDRATDRGDRATDREPVRRYQRDRPGELVHVDIKKLAGIPDGGWRIHGRGQTPGATHANVGYRFLHSAIDDRTRVVYSEILADEQGASAAAFWHRANTFFAQHGIGIERVLTDNGPCYRSRLWRTVLDQAGITH
jgi:transposase InsO family protein